MDVIGVINLSNFGSTDKTTCCFKVGDLAMICKETVYISIVISQDKTEEGSLTNS